MDERYGTHAQLQILVVEDEHHIRALLRESMLDAGYQVVEAANGVEGLQAIATSMPDAILLDALMPLMDGISMCQRLRALPGGGNVPVLMITARTDTRSITIAFEAGVTDFIEKPVNLLVLEHRVQTLIAARRAEAALQQWIAERTAELSLVNTQLRQELVEHALTEEALRHSEDQLRLMIASVEDYAIFMLDPSGHVVNWNLGAQLIKGYHATKIIGQHHSAFYTAEDRMRGLPELILQTATGDGRVEDEGWRVRKDDSRFWASVVVSAMRDRTGTLLGFVKVTRDISARKQAEEALRESEERYHTIYNALHEGLVLQHADGTIQAVNASAERILGLSAAQMMGRTSHDPVWRAIHEDGSPFPGETHPIVVSLATGQPQHTVIIGLQKPDETLAWVSVNAQPLFRNDDTTPYAAVASFIDITDLKRLEQSLRASEERYSSLIEHSFDAILLTQPDGAILTANPAATLLFRMTEADLIRSGRSGVVEISDPRLKELMEERTRTGKATGELTMKRADGTRFPAQISSTIFLDSAGLPHTSMLIRDVTEQKKTTEELTNRAFYDPLTRLPNRALFMDRLQQQVQQRMRDTTRLFAVFFVDLDGFKLVNDSLGHAMGDQLLTEVASRLTGCVRENDTVSRLGGDEFTILLDGIGGLGSATTTADRLQTLLTQPFQLGGHEVVISASMGIALSTSDATSAEDLLRYADTAMYRAKTSGKACYEVFEATMLEET